MENLLRMVRLYLISGQQSHTGTCIRVIQQSKVIDPGSCCSGINTEQGQQQAKHVLVKCLSEVAFMVRLNQKYPNSSLLCVVMNSKNHKKKHHLAQQSSS